VKPLPTSDGKWKCKKAKETEKAKTQNKSNETGKMQNKNRKRRGKSNLEQTPKQM